MRFGAHSRPRVRRYGHTAQYCQVRKAREERLTERELELCGPGYVPPQSEEECPLGPEQWAMIQRQRAIEARVEEGERLGIGKPRPGCKRYNRTITCASDVVLPSDCGCAICTSWSSFMASSTSMLEDSDLASLAPRL